MSTKHYVTFYYPGSFFDASETREIAQRGEVGEIPDYAFGYQEWDREESAVEHGGDVLRGEPKNHGPTVYFGRAYTATEIALLEPKRDYTILLSNMRSNGWAQVVRTERGNFKPLTPNVQLLPPRKKAPR